MFVLPQSERWLRLHSPRPCRVSRLAVVLASESPVPDVLEAARSTHDRSFTFGYLLHTPLSRTARDAVRTLSSRILALRDRLLCTGRRVGGWYGRRLRAQSLLTEVGV